MALDRSAFRRPPAVRLLRFVHQILIGFWAEIRPFAASLNMQCELLKSSVPC